MKLNIILSIYKVTFFLICGVVMISSNRTCGLQPVFRSDGDLRLSLVVNECSSSSLKNTLYLTFSWVCERLNILGFFGGLRLGVDIYNTCDVQEMIEPVVEAATSEGYNLGMITWKPVSRKILSLGQVLEVQITEIPKQWKPMVTASVGLLTALKWQENLTLIVTEPEVFNFFYHESRKQWICVRSVKSFNDVNTIEFSHPVIAFGNNEQLSILVKNLTSLNSVRIIIVPLDSSQIEGLPEGAFIIQPTYADLQQKISKSPQIIPTPLLMDVATPILNIVRNFSFFYNEKCNESSQNMSCLKNNALSTKNIEISYLNNQQILNFLKIEPIFDKFFYNVYKVENLDTFSHTMDNITAESLIYSTNGALQSYVKIGKYSIFNYSLMIDEIYFEERNFMNTTENGTLDICSINHKYCVQECLNYKSSSPIHTDMMNLMITLKQEPWVLAILAVATLGVIFCLAISIFIFVRLCKKDVFEGNPVLSVLLLLTLTVMYAAVVPFTLDVTSEAEFRSITTDYICLARSLAVTLSYSCAFSLMLSRCIMLATVAYEAGFMSHITGHVQSLLCLFMVAVQGALSLQVVENCEELFLGSSFIYVLSYDVLLLGLLVCACPFVYRSQRNYKEGLYFAIAIILVAIFWTVWMTAYIIFDNRWKVIIICVGLLGTSSCILGVVFIPRTYLMTSAVVRDNLASALPSLAFASSTSVLDLNYSNTQHVYDCVNIATINSASMQQTAPQAVPQCNPNFYSDEPALETERCETPDKVTRF